MIPVMLGGTILKAESVGKRVTLSADNVNTNMNYIRMKRLIDILGSLLGIIILSPFFLIIAISIKIENPKGRVFFKQVRVGMDETTFYMYKFRSMVSDAEDRLKDLLELNEVTGAMFKIKDDPRLTKIGKYIRKTSIDELPQLWNVLKGELSLVGPRPPLLRELKEYTTYDKQRLLVKPGCTGLWQVSGRNDLGFKEMVELDLKYINERTLVYDMKIIFKTIKIIVFPNSAY